MSEVDATLQAFSSYDLALDYKCYLNLVGPERVINIENAIEDIEKHYNDILTQRDIEFCKDDYTLMKNIQLIKKQRFVYELNCKAKSLVENFCQKDAKKVIKKVEDICLKEQFYDELISSYNNKSALHRRLGNLDRGIQALEHAKTFAIKYDATKNLGETLINLSAFNIEFNKQQEAISLLHRALTMFKKEIINLEIQQNNGNIETSDYSILLNSKEIEMKKLDVTKNIGIAYLNQGFAYKVLNKKSPALTAFSNAKIIMNSQIESEYSKCKNFARILHVIDVQIKELTPKKQSSDYERRFLINYSNVRPSSAVNTPKCIKKVVSKQKDDNFLKLNKDIHMCKIEQNSLTRRMKMWINAGNNIDPEQSPYKQPRPSFSAIKKTSVSPMYKANKNIFLLSTYPKKKNKSPKWNNFTLRKSNQGVRGGNTVKADHISFDYESCDHHNIAKRIVFTTSSSSQSENDCAYKNPKVTKRSALTDYNNTRNSEGIKKNYQHIVKDIKLRTNFWDTDENIQKKYKYLKNVAASYNHKKMEKTTAIYKTSQCISNNNRKKSFPDTKLQPKYNNQDSTLNDTSKENVEEIFEDENLIYKFNTDEETMHEIKINENYNLSNKYIESNDDSAFEEICNQEFLNHERFQKIKNLRSSLKDERKSKIQREATDILDDSYLNALDTIKLSKTNFSDIKVEAPWENNSLNQY